MPTTEVRIVLCMSPICHIEGVLLIRSCIYSSLFGAVSVEYTTASVSQGGGRMLEILYLGVVAEQNREFKL